MKYKYRDTKHRSSIKLNYLFDSMQYDNAPVHGLFFLIDPELCI